MILFTLRRPFKACEKRKGAIEEDGSRIKDTDEAKLPDKNLEVI